MKGFLPIFDFNSKILILGSFPSVVSRENNFYYANNRNRFWKVLAEYFGDTFETVPEKIDFLNRHQIALWDILVSCDIEGSLDSNIKNISYSNIKSLIDKSNIKTIFCNGKFSYNHTLKYCNINLGDKGEKNYYMDINCGSIWDSSRIINF